MSRGMLIAMRAWSVLLGAALAVHLADADYSGDRDIPIAIFIAILAVLPWAAWWIVRGNLRR